MVRLGRGFILFAGFTLFTLAAGLLEAQSSKAQSANSPLVGGPPPWIELVAPGGTVYSASALVKLHWCDSTRNLSSGSRNIKVNNVDKTANFDYTTGSAGDCGSPTVGTAYSQSTNAGLSGGDNS